MLLDRLIPVGFHILEAMFFVGAIGCLIVIVVAWIEIFVEGFSEDHPNDK